MTTKMENTISMTMPHLMNCRHSEDGWCLSCVNEQHEELRRAIEDASTYEYCLQACTQRLNQVLPIAKVKAIRLLEVPCGIDVLTTALARVKELLAEWRRDVRHDLSIEDISGCVDKLSEALRLD